MPELEKKDYQLALYLSCATLAVYFVALFCDFSFVDDPVYTYLNPWVTDYRIKDILTRSYFAAYIPVTLLTYCVDFFLFGNSPAGYHLTNLLFHVANVILLYYLLVRLTKNRTTAFFTTLFFAIHPVQVQTVVWISERKSVVNLLFVLLSLKYYFDYTEKKKTTTYIICFLFFALALLSKAISVGLFALFICYDFFILKKKLRKTLLDKIPFALLSITLTVITYKAQNVMGAVKRYHGGTFYSNMLTIPKGLLHYFKILLYPKDLIFYYNLTPEHSIASISVIAGISLILLMIFIMFRYAKGNGVFSFGIALFFIFLLPVSGIVPLEIIVADRYMYIPLVGLALSFFTILEKLPKDWKRKLSYTLVVIALMFSYVTVQNGLTWVEQKGIWEKILRKSPGNIRAMNTLTELSMNQKEYDRALELIINVLKIDDADPGALKNYAHYKSERLKDYRGALELLESALIADPEDKEIYFEIGKAYYALEEYDHALDILRKGMMRHYEFPDDLELNYRYVLANVYVKKIMFNEAVAEFGNILTKSSDFLDSAKRYNLLLKNLDSFNELLNACNKSRSVESVENLKALFIKLNLEREGTIFIKKIKNSSK